MSVTPISDEGPRQGALVASEPKVRVWSNWAGNQRCRVPVMRPTSEPELCRIVADAASAGLTVKAVGAGHSFTDTALTDGILLDLADYGRILEVDREACTVTVQAGARLRAISEFLWARGLAFANLGDIDVQSLAGATATATHGTGLSFGNLSSGIVAMRLIDGSGQVLECSADQNPQVLATARVGVGALGLVSTITLRVVPAFQLHAVEEPRRVDEVLEDFDALIRNHDHYEFFWVPHTGWALTKSNRRNHEAPAPRSRLAEFRQDELWTNYGFEVLNRIGTWRPSLIPRLSRLIPSSGRVEYNDRSYRVFASPRKVRFVEMEYAIPLEAAVEGLQRLRALVDGLGIPISFPVEVRAVAADDIPLSTASGRDTAFIAVHMYRSMPHEAYFHGFEAIMADLDGRPHWGKMHYRTAADLAPAYPRWDEFQSVRARLDPHGVFQNAYTRRVLGDIEA